MIGSAPTLAPSDLVAVINQNFEYALGQVVLEGELSEFKVRKERWLYFKVKDEDAVIDCFGTIYMMPGPLEDGMIVKVTGSPKLHPKFGFSFQARSIVPAGEGSLKKASELLKAKLEAEGLFLDERKRFIPYPPESVVVITSKQGAAIGDFNKVLRARWPALKVSVSDALVQGENAPESIVQAIQEANNSADSPDVIVLIRGGGSAEDLGAFNDERIVRAVASSRIPTLVAIGHEQDVSLAELAADMRASTPSNAAELLTPDVQSELAELKRMKDLVSNLLVGQTNRIRDAAAHKEQVLTNLLRRLLADYRQENSHAKRELDLVNPKHVLKRGYALVKSKGKVVRRAADTNAHEKVQIVFHDSTKDAVIK